MRQSKQPNILILISDQQQQSTFAPDSPCRTPTVDRIRKNGVVFTEARSVNAICSPARASLMTGLLPHHHGMVDNTHCVEPFRASFQMENPTLPARLKDHGYRLGYFGKWHVERTGNPGLFGIERFETEHHNRTFTRSLSKQFTVNHNGYNERTLYGVHDEPVEETEEYFFCSEAIQFIRDVSAEGDPWCTVFSTNAPHDPYLAPREIYDTYDPAQLELPPSFSDPMTDKPNVYRRLKEVWKDLTPEHYREVAACYYANCTMVDLQFGRILEELRTTGQLENTLIVALSDHGDLMGAHGLLCKGVPAFDEGYRVPLIFSWPGHIEPGTCDTYVSTVDIAPTILELVNAEAFPWSDGSSLVEYLEGGEDPDRVVYAEFYGQRLAYTQRIVWKAGFKYVYNGFDFDELYDLNNDPSEVENLIGRPEHQEKTEELAREMWDQAKRTGDAPFLESEYFMYRFAPVGPETAKQSSIYNRGA